MNSLPPNCRLIPGFPGYCISDDGVVWTNLKGIWKRRRSSIVKKQRSSYEQITLRREGQYVTKHIHRLILEAFVGPCPSCHETRHLNGNSIDNRLENLAWGTRKQNSDDKKKHGTLQVKERNGQAKLSQRDVDQIRHIRRSHTLQFLSEKFGVSISQIKRIVYGKSWI